MGKKKVAILQSNYIPWKGYFDMIASVDEFIIYDDMQFTKNDWRNRNKIKTPKGLEWLSVPVGQAISRRVRDVELPAGKWGDKHWRTLVANYSRATYFKDVAPLFEVIYREETFQHLTTLNRRLIEAVCDYLHIQTTIRYSWDYTLGDGKTERLVDLCKQAGASQYISGPAAMEYLDVNLFAEENITVEWFSYAGYPEYPQLWGAFEHGVTILDLLFNCGPESVRFMQKSLTPSSCSAIG